MWLAALNRKDCKSCLEAFKPSPRDDKERQKAKENGAPCHECKPEMWPINSKAISIYNSCSDQVILSMSGVISIKQNAVIDRMRLEGVKKKNRLDLLDDILFISRKVISLRNEKKKEDDFKRAKKRH